MSLTKGTVHCYCNASSKTCNSSGTIDITDNAKSPQKLAIAPEPLILLAYRVSSKTCNSIETVDFIGLQVFLKILQ